MLYPDVQSKLIDRFDGAVLRLDAFNVPPNNGLYAENVQYLRGQFGKRYGHSSVASVTGAVTSMANWFFVFNGSQVSVVVMYAPATGVKIYNQADGTSGTIMTQSGAAGSVHVPTGQRIYEAFYDATGRIGYAGGQIYGWNLGADPLFAAPIQNVITASETGAGVCTAGTRRIGYITTTRNGYTGMLQPVNSSTIFTPISFTSTGSKNIQCQVTGALPGYMVGGSIQIVATTTTNKNRWFAVPGAKSLAANPTTITFSIDDDDLAATGTDVTAYITALGCAVDGTPPFKPSAIFPYSSRMGFIAFDKSGFPVIYMSNPNDYQRITADQHGIYLEGEAQPVQGVSLRGVCYIAATDCFYSTEDNGDVPVTWTSPQKVDGSIGILSPTCLSSNPAQGYCWVASKRGLYLFQGGTFPALPISYYQQPDWDRINWNVPTTVQVSDDTLRKVVSVMAPLTNVVAAVSGSTVTTKTPHLYQTGVTVTIAGATGTQAITVTGANTFTIPGPGTPTVGATIYPQIATAELTWDYTEGATNEAAKYAIFSKKHLSGATAVVQNSKNYLPEVWFAPSASGVLARRNDGSEANPYRDIDTAGTQVAFEWWYRTGLVPGVADDVMGLHDFHGVHFRASGSGPLSLRAYTLDDAQSVVPVASPVVLQVNPGRPLLIKWFLRGEHESILIGSSGGNMDDYGFVASIKPYWTQSALQR